MYVCMFMHWCMYVCMYVHVCKHVCVYVRVCVCMPTHVDVLYMPLYECCSKKFPVATDDVTSLKSEMKTITRYTDKN